MKKDYRALADNVGSSVQELAAEPPEVMRNFQALSNSVKHEAEFLDEKTIRLIGLAVAVSMHCEPCISAHARILAEFKVPRREVAEAVSIIVKMGGAPALTYAADALRLRFVQRKRKLISVKENAGRPLWERPDVTASPV